METIADDDLCPICHQLLFRPVVTRCRHRLCGACMAQWADASACASAGRTTWQMTILAVDAPAGPAAAETEGAEHPLEARCPMCRQQTAADPDRALARHLAARYPRTYAERRAEERGGADGGGGGDGAGGGARGGRRTVETITLDIGNRHRFVMPAEGSSNMHKWVFFVRPSRVDIIDEVHIKLHSTFAPNRIICRRPPYEVRRVGWGYFTIRAYIILKPGYSWLSEDAERAPSGAPKAMLPLDWTLDFDGFDGRGSMGRCRLKVRLNVGGEDDEEEDEEDEEEDEEEEEDEDEEDEEDEDEDGDEDEDEDEEDEDEEDEDEDYTSDSEDEDEESESADEDV